MNELQKRAIQNILTNLQLAFDEMSALPESYKRDEAYELIVKAHQAVAILLVNRK